MKIAIVTEAIADYVSGGLQHTIYVLNELKKLGHDVCCFVKHPPYQSLWLHADFPIYPIGSNIWEEYDGILVCIFSPVAELVATHKNSQDRFFLVHANEGLFTYNGQEWTKRAIDSYKLPLKLMCVSSYLQILMEQVYNRNVIGLTVPPGVDDNIFNDIGRTEYDGGILNIAIFNRGGWIRGVDTALQAVNGLDPKKFKINVIPDGVRDRKLVANIFKQSHVYIDASRLAGSPTIPKEAMICGCIPICTYYGAVDYILSGYNGFIIPPDNMFAITNTVKFLSEDPELVRQISQNAIEYCERFTWDKIAQRMVFAINEGLLRMDLLETKVWR